MNVVIVFSYNTCRVLLEPCSALVCLSSCVGSIFCVMVIWFIVGDVLSFVYSVLGLCNVIGGLYVVMNMMKCEFTRLCVIMYTVRPLLMLKSSLFVGEVVQFIRDKFVVFDCLHLLLRIRVDCRLFGVTLFAVGFAFKVDC
eukprot:gene3289-2271_t